MGEGKRGPFFNLAGGGGQKNSKKKERKEKLKRPAVLHRGEKIFTSFAAEKRKGKKVKTQRRDALKLIPRKNAVTPLAKENENKWKDRSSGEKINLTYEKEGRSLLWGGKGKRRILFLSGRKAHSPQKRIGRIIHKVHHIALRQTRKSTPATTGKGGAV